MVNNVNIIVSDVTDRDTDSERNECLVCVQKQALSYPSKTILKYRVGLYYYLY